MGESIDDFGREYGRLVLKELENLNEGQKEMRKDMDRRFQELNEKINEFKGTEKDVEDLKEWKDGVTEVWSKTQMQQSKNEIYRQKNQWQKVTGILIAIQVLWALFLAFKDQIV